MVKKLVMVKITNKFDAIKGNYPMMMRFGNQMVLPKEFNNLNGMDMNRRSVIGIEKQGRPLDNMRERWKKNIIFTFIRKNQETRQMFVRRI